MSRTRHHHAPARARLIWLVWLAWPLFALVACSATPDPAPTDRPYALVLGTAQDAGLPQLGCRALCCEAARADASLRRLVSSVLIVDPRTNQRWLLDASPDLGEQVELAREHAAPTAPGRPALFAGIFLTHAHLGHYTGLAELGREAYGSEATQVWGTESMVSFIEGNGPWSLLVSAGHIETRILPPGNTIELAPELTISSIPVPHRDEFSDTVAYRVQGPGGALLYLPDIDQWERWPLPIESVLVDVEHALLDGTFFSADELPGRSIADIPHPLISESIRRFSDLPRRERAKIHFTHLNHSNPAATPHSPAQGAILRAGMDIATGGMLLPL